MAFSAKTWNIGDVLTAADLNLYLRDNALLGGPTATTITALNALFGGTPGDGARGFIRGGSTPYQFTPLVYDATYGHWVSPEINCGYAAVGSSTSSVAVPATGVGGAIDYGALITAGLTLQIRFGGLSSNTNGANGNAFIGAYIQGMTQANPSSIASATAAEITTSGAGPYNTWVASGWTSVGSLGSSYDIALIGVYSRGASGAVSHSCAGGVEARWIS